MVYLLGRYLIQVNWLNSTVGTYMGMQLYCIISVTIFPKDLDESHRGNGNSYQIMPEAALLAYYGWISIWVFQEAYSFLPFSANTKRRYTLCLLALCLCLHVFLFSIRGRFFGWTALGSECLYA